MPMVQKVVCECFRGGTKRIPVTQIRERVSVYVIIFDRDNNVLLMKMTNGFYFFPGGEKEPFETDLEAAKREITDEETGIEYEVLGKVDFATAFFHFDDNNDSFHSTMLFYYGRALTTEINKSEEFVDGVASAEWIPFMSVEPTIFMDQQVYNMYVKAMRLIMSPARSATW